MSKQEDSSRLTGKVFIIPKAFRDSQKPAFQFEAVIDGHITRLQAEGELPKDCLFDRRHSGFKITSVLETFPPQYQVECSCGNSILMKDINAFFELLANLT